MKGNAPTGASLPPTTLQLKVGSISTFSNMEFAKIRLSKIPYSVVNCTVTYLLRQQAIAVMNNNLNIFALKSKKIYSLYTKMER